MTRAEPLREISKVKPNSIARKKPEKEFTPYLGFIERCAVPFGIAFALQNKNY